MIELLVHIKYSEEKAQFLLKMPKKMLASCLRRDLDRMKLPHPPESNIRDFKKDGVSFSWETKRHSPLWTIVESVVHDQYKRKHLKEAKRECQILDVWMKETYIGHFPSTRSKQVEKNSTVKEPERPERLKSPDSRTSEGTSVQRYNDDDDDSKTSTNTTWHRGRSLSRSKFLGASSSSSPISRSPSRYGGSSRHRLPPLRRERSLIPLRARPSNSTLRQIEAIQSQLHEIQKKCRVPSASASPSRSSARSSSPLDIPLPPRPDFLPEIPPRPYPYPYQELSPPLISTPILPSGGNDNRDMTLVDTAFQIDGVCSPSPDCSSHFFSGAQSPPRKRRKNSSESSGPPSNAEDILRLTRQFWDTRSRVIAVSAKCLDIEKQMQNVLGGSLSNKTDSSLELADVQRELEQAEALLKEERARTEHVESVLKDVERECQSPTIVPLLLEALKNRLFEEAAE